jgi:hypothetical protein
MQRIATTNRSVDLFGAGKDGFRAGNLGAGIEATAFSNDWCNSVQEEIANVIEGQGIALALGDRTQLRQAITKMIQSGNRTVVIDGVTFAPAVTTSGQVVYWDNGNARFDLAIADGTNKQNAVGVADLANTSVAAFGDATLFAGLTPGARYYLSGTVAGGLTLVAPGMGKTVGIGIARTATEAFIDIDQDASTTALARVQRFTASGSFVAPVGQVFVTLIGGGASGSGNGNSSSFGALLTATGGSGVNGGTPNGFAGSGGVNGGYYGLSMGGGSPFGQGGVNTIVGGTSAAAGYGAGAYNGTGQGYGGGGWYVDEPVNVTPGTSYSITIAAAVAGATGGLCIVRW